MSLPQEPDELSAKQESGEPGGSAHQIPRRHGNARHDDKKAHDQKSSAGGGKTAKTSSNALCIKKEQVGKSEVSRAALVP